MSKSPILPNSQEEKALIIKCMVLTGAVLILDQVTKALIEKYITTPVQVIPNLFNIVRVGNTGAAWGILEGRLWLLLGISLGFLLFVIFSFRKLTEGWPERFYALALVVSGIFGNSIDRIWRNGRVVDFLDFYIGKHHWPSFNVADSAICIGVGIYILSSFMRPQADEKTIHEVDDKNATSQG